jgi:CBS domain-containing protein
MKVADIMTAPVLTVSPGTSLKDAATIMVEKGITGLPVVDSDGRVIGVVSETQILVEEQAEPEQKSLAGRLFAHGEASPREKVNAPTVGDTMTAPAITIDPDASVSRAATMMLESNVHRLLVTDAGGTLVGIVTRVDLMRAFVRPDEALEREIRGVIAMFSVDAEGVGLAVEKGEVRLAGTVDSKIVAEAIPVLVQRVPGVVAVTGELEWRWDPELPHDRDVLAPPRASEEGRP